MLESGTIGLRLVGEEMVRRRGVVFGLSTGCWGVRPGRQLAGGSQTIGVVMVAIVASLTTLGRQRAVIGGSLTWLECVESQQVYVLSKINK